MTLISNVPKKNWAVILLSTMDHSALTNASNQNKSEINLYCNATKGGVDTLDKNVIIFPQNEKQEDG